MATPFYMYARIYTLYIYRYTRVLVRIYECVCVCARAYLRVHTHTIQYIYMVRAFFLFTFYFQPLTSCVFPVKHTVSHERAQNIHLYARCVFLPPAPPRHPHEFNMTNRAKFHSSRMNIYAIVSKKYVWCTHRHRLTAFVRFISMCTRYWK